MTVYTHQAAMAVPDANLAAARRMGELLGWGPGNYSAPLLKTEGGISYWGLSTVCTQGFVESVHDPYGAEVAEEDRDEYNACVAEVIPVLLAAFESASTRSQGEQFDAFCAENGLERVTTTEEI